MKDVTNIVISAAALSLASEHGLTVVLNKTDNVAHPRRPVKAQTSTLVSFSESFVTELSDVNFNTMRGYDIDAKIDYYVEQTAIDKDDMLLCVVYDNQNGIPELSTSDYADVPSINGVRLNCVAGFIYESRKQIMQEFRVSEISEELQAKIEARMESELMLLNEYARNDLLTLAILDKGRVLECVEYVRYAETLPDEKYTNEISKTVIDFIKSHTKTSI